MTARWYMLIQRGYFYMPEHPVKWDINFEQIYFSKAYKPWVSFILLLLLAVSCALASAYDILTHLFVQPKLYYNMGTLFLHLLCILTCGFLPLFVVTLFTSRQCFCWCNKFPGLFQQFNNHAELAELSTATQCWLLDIADFDMLVGICFAVPFPFFILVTSLSFRFDPFYFVLQDIFGDLDNHSTLIGFLFVFRLITVLCAFEVARSIVYSISFILATLCRVIYTVYKFCNILPSSSFTKTSVVLHFYYLFYFWWLKFNVILTQATSVVISVGFWAVVCASWILIKAKDQIPAQFFIILLGLDAVMFVSLSWLVYVASKVAEHSGKMTKKWLVDTKTNCCLEKNTRNRRKELLLLWKISASLTPLQLDYKPFLKIDQQFFTDFNMNLISRIFDAILLINPNSL